MLSRSTIIDAIWGFDADVSANDLEAFVHLLRSKLEHPGESKLIRTIRGVGYTLPGRRRMMRASIRVRLVAWYFVVLSTGMLLLGAMVWILLRHALLESLDESLVSRKASFVRFLEEESQGPDLPALKEESREYSTGLPVGHSLRVWAPDGSLLFAAPTPASVDRAEPSPHEGGEIRAGPPSLH